MTDAAPFEATARRERMRALGRKGGLANAAKNGDQLRANASKGGIARQKQVAAQKARPIVRKRKPKPQPAPDLTATNPVVASIDKMLAELG